MKQNIFRNFDANPINQHLKLIVCSRQTDLDMFQASIYKTDKDR